MKDEITSAIGAHGMWKSRLKGAIDTGKLDVPVETVRADNQCAFGKWLYGTTIPSNVKGTPRYGKVKGLHADFHKAAAKVAEVALVGKKEEATKMLEPGSEYANVSANLTSEMMAWIRENG